MGGCRAVPGWPAEAGAPANEATGPVKGLTMGGATDSANFPRTGKVHETVEGPGTHRGHNKVFLPLLERHPVRPRSCSLLRVKFSHPAFTAVTRVQIPSGTPNLFNHLRGFLANSAVQRRYKFLLV